MSMNKLLFSVASVMIASAAFCEGASAYRVEDGRIILDSPFALEIGSTEYAKAFGKLIRTSAHANYDPQTQKTTTNFSHHVEAYLAEPYFGCDKVSLIFKGEEKTLESCYLLIGRWASRSGKMMTFSECRETVDQIAVDMGKRVGIVMRCMNEDSEEEIKRQIKSSLDNYRRKKETCYGLMLSFVNFAGEKKGKLARVDYRVSGEMSDKGDRSITISYTRHFEHSWPSYKPGDTIPVYTNEMVSAASGSLVPTEEQKQSHEEAKKLRETIKHLFDVDLDKPSETYDLLSVASLTNDEKDVKREWTVMERPFEGLTERKVNQSVRLFAIPFGVCALRCPYEGDVSAAELKAQAERILAGLERELGAKIPEADTKNGMEMLAKRYGDGVPTFGDTKALLSLDKKTHFVGKVGDLAIEICSAEPRYAKKDGKYEIVCRGAVVLNFVQSPIITKSPPKK